MRTARCAAWTNAATIPSISPPLRACGTCQPSPNAVALDDTVCQGSSAGPSGAPPSHGRWVEALRPACASWMPNRVGPPRRRAACSARSSAASLSSLYKPRHDVRDTAATFDGGGLDDDEAGARVRELREVLQMPVGRRAVARAVLTHRCDDKTIRQLDLADRDRLEQTAGHERSRGNSTGSMIGQADPRRQELPSRLPAMLRALLAILALHRLALGIAAALIVVYALVGFLWVPHLLRTNAQRYVADELGRTLALGKMSFNPFTFRLERARCDVVREDRRRHRELHRAGRQRRARVDLAARGRSQGSAARCTRREPRRRARRLDQPCAPRTGEGRAAARGRRSSGPVAAHTHRSTGRRTVDEWISKIARGRRRSPRRCRRSASRSRISARISITRTPTSSLRAPAPAKRWSGPAASPRSRSVPRSVRRRAVAHAQTIDSYLQGQLPVRLVDGVLSLARNLSVSRCIRR